MSTPDLPKLRAVAVRARIGNLRSLHLLMLDERLNPQFHRLCMPVLVGHAIKLQLKLTIAQIDLKTAG